MERKVIVGYWYIVGGPAGATVTVLGEENPCCTVPEGGQGSFYAQAPVVVVSDESVTLSQVVNFKVALLPGHGGSGGEGFADEA